MGFDKRSLDTGADTTWCPGCNNYMLLSEVRNVVSEICEKEGKERKDFSISAGIGCHGKIFDYLNLGGVYSLHGRVIPTITGMKMGNPSLDIIGFGGDGDTYAEGVSHLLHASRTNPDVTMVVHNNRVFALTTGQATPTSEEGFVTKAEPKGHKDPALNPIELAISNNTSFVARIDPTDFKKSEEVLKKAMEWDGFALVDVVMPCIKYTSDISELKSKFYWLEEKKRSKEEALEKAREWTKGTKLPLGIFYRSEKPVLSDRKESLRELKKEGKGGFEKG